MMTYLFPVIHEFPEFVFLRLLTSNYFTIINVDYFRRTSNFPEHEHSGMRGRKTKLPVLDRKRRGTDSSIIYLVNNVLRLPPQMYFRFETSFQCLEVTISETTMGRNKFRGRTGAILP